MNDLGRLLFPLHSERQYTFARRLVTDEDHPGELREETDDELRARIKRALAHELGPS